MMWDSLPGGRASLTLPRAILRVAAEKAGAGMHRLGFLAKTPLREWDSRRRLDQKSPLSVDSELSPYL